MNEIELKELFKVAVETLREQTIRSLLEADMTYQIEKSITKQKQTAKKRQI